MATFLETLLAKKRETLASTRIDLAKLIDGQQRNRSEIEDDIDVLTSQIAEIEAALNAH